MTVKSISCAQRVNSGLSSACVHRNSARLRRRRRDIGLQQVRPLHKVVLEGQSSRATACALTRLCCFLQLHATSMSSKHLAKNPDPPHNYYRLPICVTRFVVKDGRTSVPQWISDMGKKRKNGAEFDQASAVPYRFRNGEIEFCLITSSSSRRWCFPKGIIDPGETSEEAALKEAEEEAGLSGEICGPPLGDYEYSKWDRSLSVVVMLMKVHEAADEWEESHLRDRRWAGLDEAEQLLGRRRLQQFLLQAAERLEVGVAKN